MQKEGTSRNTFKISLLMYGCLMIGGLLLGSLYAVYKNNEDTAIMNALYTYIHQEEIGAELKVLLLKSGLTYAKKIIVVIVLSLFTLGMLLNYGIIFMTLFSYGYVSAGFTMLYGIRGSLLSFMLCGLQMSILVYAMFSVQQYALKKYAEPDSEKINVKDMSYFIIIVVLMIFSESVVCLNKSSLAQFILRG